MPIWPRAGSEITDSSVLAPDQQARIWKLRTLALGLSMAEKGDAKAISFVEDTAVAPERLRDYIAEFLAVIARNGTRAGVYAHASVGCLHVRPIVDLKTDEGVQRFEAIAAEVADLVLKYGGALSGEHGDGLVRSPFQEKMFGPELYQAFRELKRTFDPQNLLNPGKIVDAPPLTANLRFGRSLRHARGADDVRLLRRRRAAAAPPSCARAWASAARPAAGRCARRTRRRATSATAPAAGPMPCGWRSRASWVSRGSPTRPSARCSTFAWSARRARASARPTWTWPGSRPSSCTSTIAPTGCRCGTWCSATSPRSAGWGAGSPRSRAGWRGAGSVRWLQRGPPRHRPPPHPAGLRPCVRRGTSWLARRPRVEPGPGPGSRDVLLFPDTFINYYEPEHGLSALRLLEASARRVQLGLPRRRLAPPLRCCGRPLISNGLLDVAVTHARDNVRLLEEWARGRRHDRRLRAELFADDQGRLPRAAARRGSPPGRDRRGGVSDLRRVPRIAAGRNPGFARRPACPSGPGPDGSWSRVTAISVRSSAWGRCFDS